MRHVPFPRLLAGFAAMMSGFLASAGAFAAEPTPWQMGLQPPSGPVMTQMNSFHDLLLVIITAITLFVMGLLIYVMWRFRASKNPNPSRTTHNTLIEVVWTVVPVLILIVIAVPSFRLLYFMDRAPNPELTLQVTGYQWYWGYSYPDQQIPEFSSYMVRDEDIQEGQVRLLSVDKPVVLPAGVDVQVLVTAGDVLHSWALPSQGVKRDAVPGRMNETWVHFDEPGTYFGQCSEICGTEHGYMPIEIQVVTAEEFDAWVMEEVAGLDLDEPPQLLTMTWEEAQQRDVAALDN
jgi:cytochrome c oxidase subunit 2